MRSRIHLARALASAGVLFLAAGPLAAQFLDIDVGPYQFTVPADTFAVGQAVGIGISVTSTQPPQVPYKYVGGLLLPAGTPNFVVVIPASGTAPAFVGIGLNPNVVAYLPAGHYEAAVQFAAPGQSPPYAAAVVELTVMPPSPPAVTSLVSAASLQPAISPGEVISIFGAHLGTPPLSAQYDGTGLYPTTLGNTTVTFNGTLAPLLYVSIGQINAVVPFGVAGQKTVNVVVTHDSQASPVFSLPITDTSPAMFTVTQTGKGQGAILNAGPGALSPGTPNGPENPVPQGSAISIFATGGGVFSQSFTPNQDGLISLGASGPPAAPVSLTIGGQPAKVIYAGAAPYAVPGMIQVNAVVPQGIVSGPQPVVLTIGNNNNASQQVTAAVK
jgi:uncharacterized protein (TIGR03437 family)